MKKRTSEQVFVDLLRKTEIEGRHVSDAQNASTYAPRIFARRPDNEKHKLAQFEHAMEKLFAEGRIKVAEEKRRRRIVYLGDDAQCSVNI